MLDIMHLCRIGEHAGPRVPLNSVILLASLPQLVADIEIIFGEVIALIMGGERLLGSWKTMPRAGCGAVMVAPSTATVPRVAWLLSSRIVVMRPNPGRIADIFDIDLPHSRDRLSPEFEAAKRRVLHALNATLVRYRAGVIASRTATP